MKEREAILKMLLGENKIISMPSKMIFHTTRGKIDGLKQMIFGGSGYVSNEIMSKAEDWARLDCEIIIIPKKLFEGWKDGCGARIGDVLLNHFDDDRMWEKSKTL